MQIKIYNVYNNIPLPNSSFRGKHGESFLIQAGNDLVMLDVGGNGKILLHNMALMNFSPNDVTHLVFSHGHYDHTWALPDFLDARTTDKKLPVFAHPQVFEEKRLKLGPITKQIGFPSLTPAQKAKLEFHLSADAQEILPFLHTTGEIINRIHKQGLEKRAQHKIGDHFEIDPVKDDLSLVLDVEEGIVIITGCAHAGILNILAQVKATSSQKILAILGGSHMARYTPEEVQATGKLIKNQFDFPDLYLNHCTDNLPMKFLHATQAISILEQNYSHEKVHPCYTGTKLSYMRN